MTQQAIQQRQNQKLASNESMTWKLPTGVSEKSAREIVCAFLDTAATSFGRATHYNTREEQQRAEIAAHEAFLRLDRDLYALFLMLPGVTDRSRQMGMKNLLGTHRNGESLLTGDQEREVLQRMISELPPQRVLKTFQAFRVGSEKEGIRKANNARTRKLILRTLLSSDRLELWSIKYRSKVAESLTHAWGKRTTSIIRSILAKDVWTRKERKIIRATIGRFVPENGSSPQQRVRRVYECVSFVLGNRNRMNLPLFKAFEAAKKDIREGKRLPIEVLEGIRSTFHKDTPKDDVLKIAKDTLTRGQKMAVQKQAKAADIDVQLNPLGYDPVRLYVYAFEMGLTEEISAALDEKAKKAAAGFPANFNRIGIIVDMSRSMMGNETQKLRPAATVLAIRDMLQHTAKEHETVYVGGEDTDKRLVRPSGDTALSEKLLDLLGLEDAVDAIFVLSDGYENRAAGRFGEVVHQVREIGIRTPIYHLNPVFAAEAGQVKKLTVKSETGDDVPTLPAQNPSSLGISFLRGLLETDPVRGINALVRLALPAKGGSL